MRNPVAAGLSGVRIPSPAPLRFKALRCGLRVKCCILQTLLFVCQIALVSPISSMRIVSTYHFARPPILLIGKFFSLRVVVAYRVLIHPKKTQTIVTNPQQRASFLDVCPRGVGPHSLKIGAYLKTVLIQHFHIISIVLFLAQHNTPRG